MPEPAHTPQIFETEIFAKPVWRLDDLSKASDVVEAARKQDVALISYRENGREASLKPLADAGFYPIETLITFEKKLDVLPTWPENISLATSGDAVKVADLARHCFAHDRYHADAALSDHIADEIKARWMYNAVSGRADIVFLHKQNEHITGFNACMVQGRVAVIDLMGVEQFSQGHGIGRALVQAMACYYHEKVDFLRAGTQKANITSQNFYDKLGFIRVAEHTTWHWT